ncbi:MAG TPA: MFS transporter [Pseudonocardiaceae bacterium]|nr:MFS transporter [Pseudonocardiaceae bacterium]
MTASSVDASSAVIRWGTPRARGVLATTIVGSSMAMIDGTIVNIALPRIGAEFGASVAGLQWIVDGYLLSLAALVLVAGVFGDRYGRRKVYLIGVGLFGGASLLCGLAPSTTVLVVCRIIQGVAGALVSPGALAILQSSFARDDRARAIGAWSGLGGVATAIGPLLGGFLVQVWSWRLAFLINPPVAVICILLAFKFVPESSDEQAKGKRPDLISSGMIAIGLAGITALLVEAPSEGITNPLVLGAGIAGVAGLTAFVIRQRMSANPLVPAALFANPTFTLANVLTFAVYTALGGVMMLMVLQLQVSLNYPPTLAGLSNLPLTILMLFLSARSGKLASRIGPKLQLTIGPLLIAAGMWLLRDVTPGASYVFGVLPGILVFGLGLACVVAPVTATVLAAAPDHLAGAASGMNNAVARTGGLLAVAVLPAVTSLSGAAYRSPAALTASWRMALLICAGLAVVGGILGLFINNNVLRGPAPSEPEPGPDAPQTPAPIEDAPHPGDCLHCGVEGPPTHVRPSRATT